MEKELKELRAFVESHGAEFTAEQKELLGTEDAVKGLDFFNNGGLSYYDERNDQSIAIWAVYLTADGKMEVAYLWNYGQAEDWVEDADFNIDNFRAFGEWEVIEILERAKEIWHN